MKPLQIFQNKILRDFLKQSFFSSVPSLYFLCGELPIEARLHIDLLTLFHNVWSNPQTKMFEIVQYIMKMATESSTTWSAHVRLLCRMYDLPDPLALMQQLPMSKLQWTTLVSTKVTVYHEADLRGKALKNSSLEYFNVQLIGLTGQPHLVIAGVKDTRAALKLRVHLKFLTGDVLSFEKLSRDRGGDPKCRLCMAPYEHTQHILTECRSTAEIRERLYPNLVNIVAVIDPSSGILIQQQTPNRILNQFIIDPASINLPSSYRISYQHPQLQDLYSLSRDWCFAIYNRRARLLKALKIVLPF